MTTVQQKNLYNEKENCLNMWNPEVLILFMAADLIVDFSRSNIRFKKTYANHQNKHES